MSAGPHQGSNTVVQSLPPTGWRHEEGREGEAHLLDICRQSERTNYHKADKVRRRWEGE